MCAIPGKMSNEANKKGEAWISKEGIKKLIQYMDEYKPEVISGFLLCKYLRY